MSRPPSRTVFVGNLPFGMTEEMLAEVFSEVGPVKSSRIAMDRETGKMKGFGFVQFFDIPTATAAMRNLSGREVLGRQLRVNFAEEESDEPGAPPRRPGGSGPPGPPGPGPGGWAGGGGGGPPLGMGAARAAAAGAAALLGAPGPPPPGSAADAITAVLARKSRADLWAVLAQVRALAARDGPAAARQLLVTHPQLAAALFQAQVAVGLVVPPPPAEGHRAMLRQVMALSPDQVAALPPDHRAQVVALQAYVRDHGMP